MNKNYMEKQPIWKPYLRNDVLSLMACVLKYNNIMKDIFNQSMRNDLASLSRTIFSIK